MVLQILLFVLWAFAPGLKSIELAGTFVL